jgi:hypothetical protein
MQMNMLETINLHILVLLSLFNSKQEEIVNYFCIIIKLNP